MKNSSDGRVQENEARAVEIRDVDSLEIHEVLAGLPMCTQHQFEALCTSINTTGLKKPLTVIGNKIIDGRNRFDAVKACGFRQVAVIPAPKGTDPLAYAIESAVTGRNLTKSGIVLFLFLKHPDLTAARARQERQNQKRVGACDKNHTLPGKGSTDFTALAEKYRVPREYFSILSTLRDEADDEQWNLICNAILAAEASIPALKAGCAGKTATKGKKRSDPKYHLLAPQVAVTLCSAFKAWGKINWNEHGKLHERALYGLESAFKMMPDEVRAANMRAIQQWPDHDRKELAKLLKTRSGK